MENTIKEMQFLLKEIAQTDLNIKPIISKTNQNKTAEKILNNIKNKPSITHSTNHEKDIWATYHPVSDYITIHPKNNFQSPQHYYRTLFHEFAHATGHETRLKRKPIGMKRVKKQQKLYEELTAEFTVILLCKKCRIFNKVRQSIARNIIDILVQIKETNWDKRIKSFENAKHAVNYILGEIK